MNQTSPGNATTALSGPALRLHLVELFAERDDPRAAVAMAKEAEAYIVGKPDTVRIPEISTEALAAGILAESERAAKVKPTGPWEHTDVPPDVEKPPRPPAPIRAFGRAWPPARVSELERLIAAGITYAEIADRMGSKSAGAIASVASKYGFTARYPRVPGGKLLFTPYPLDLPWPPPEAQRPGVPVASSPAEPPKSERDLPRQRTCLKCGKPFASTHAGNRICKSCTPVVANAYEPTPAKVGP